MPLRLFSAPVAGGLLSLTAMSAMPLWFAQSGAASVLVWAVGLMALAALAVFAWRSERWPRRPRAALKLAGIFAAAGGAVFCLAAIVVRMHTPELGFVQAGLRGGPGLALALALCPCLTAIALAGSVCNALAPPEPPSLDP